MSKRVTPYGPPSQGGRRGILPFGKGELEGVVCVQAVSAFTVQPEIQVAPGPVTWVTYFAMRARSVF